MCPACLATGLYVVGGLSAGGVATFLAAKVLRKPPEPTKSTASAETRRHLACNGMWHATRRTRNEPTEDGFASRMVCCAQEVPGQGEGFTRQRDALAAERRKLPMVAIEKEYVFQGPEGRRTLADLFDGKQQLLVYHFMFGPDWGDEGCPACSFVADNFAGSLVHLGARDTAFAVISRAPLDKIERFKKRMGWSFPWLSSFGYRLQLRLRSDARREARRLQLRARRRPTRR